MHYLCLVYRNPTDERERDLSAESHALVEALSESGYDVTALSLAPADEASSLRRTGDGLVLSEGPVTEGSARLQSLYVIGARDLNDAVRLVSWLPEAAQADIEIRPITSPARSGDRQPDEQSGQDVQETGAAPIPVSG